MTNEELKAYITAHTPEAEFEEAQYLNAIIPADKFHALAKDLHNDPATDFNYLVCLSGVDWKTHLMTVYHLESKKHNHLVVLKVKIEDRVNPVVDTVSDLWKTAHMHEREVYDLFGIKFNGHTDMRRLFMDDTWGFPLRKDYTDDVTIVQL